MISQKIKQTRKAHGLSAAQCARMVKVAERTWHRWEDGSRQMPEGAWDLFLLKLKDVQ